jgi:hypothetical protein
MFIKNMASILKPLYELLSKDRRFIWTVEEENIFNEIKRKWAEDLKLHIPDLDGNFTLESDASNTGLGAVLYENNKPVAFISRSLSNAEKNYSITEREVLAALWAMEKLEYFLFGKPFKLISDHKAITEIKNKVNFGSPRIQRWFERLERFHFEPIYKEGKEIIIADALSRYHEKETDTTKETEVMRIHVEHHHRKAILEECKKAGIDITSSELTKILDYCLVCAKVDPKTNKSCQYLETEKPGDILGVDVMQYTQKEMIVVAIDYFSRKLFAREIRHKEANEITDFM